jgi:hypothetical protein
MCNAIFTAVICRIDTSVMGERAGRGGVFLNDSVGTSDDKATKIRIP